MIPQSVLVTARPIRVQPHDTYTCARCGIRAPRASRKRSGYCTDCWPIVKKERWT